MNELIVVSERKYMHAFVLPACSYHNNYHYYTKNLWNNSQYYRVVKAKMISSSLSDMIDWRWWWMLLLLFDDDKDDDDGGRIVFLVHMDLSVVPV